MARLLFSFLSILSLSVPLTARQLLTGPTYGPMRDVGAGTIGTDGRGFVAIWNARGTVARRLDSGGVPVAESVQIAGEQMTLHSPQWVGTHYLAAAASGEGVRIARISREGLLLSRTTIEPSQPVSSPYLATDGERVLLLGRSTRFNGPAVVAWILDRHGNVLVDEQVLSMGSNRCLTQYQAVAVAGVFRVAISHCDVTVHSIHFSGELGPTLLIEAPAGGAAIATDGTRTLIFFNMVRTGLPPTPTVALLEDDRVVRRTTLETGELRDIQARRAIWTGDAYTLVYAASSPARDRASVSALRVSAEGEVLTAEPVMLWSQPSYIWLEEVSWNGTVLVPLVRVSRSLGSVTYALPVTKDLLPVDAAMPLRLVTRGPLDQIEPMIQPSGDGYLALWVERGAEGDRLLVAPLDAVGRLKRAAIELDRTEWHFGPRDLAVGRSEALVVWGREALKGVRLSLEGDRIDVEPMHLASGHFESAVLTFGTTFYYLGLSESRYYPASDDVDRSYAVLPSGITFRLADVIDTPLPEARWGIAAERFGHVAWNGSRFAVVWTASYFDRYCYFPICPSEERDFFRIVDAAGNPLSGTVEVPRESTVSGVVGREGSFLVLLEPFDDGWQWPSVRGPLLLRSYRTAGGAPSLSAQWTLSEAGMQARLVRAGSGSVAAWKGQAPLVENLYVRPLDHDGIPLAEPRLMTTGAGSYDIAAHNPTSGVILSSERAPASIYLTRHRLYSLTIAEPALRPAAPELLHAQRSGAVVRLEWQDRSEDEEGFVVEQWSGTEWVTLASTPADATVAYVTLLSGMDDSPLRVRAFHGNDFSDPSNELIAVQVGRRRSVSP